MGKLTDEWQTPQWLFDELNKEFSFDIDLCATEKNNKCELFMYNVFNFYPSFLTKSGFMNPPYSNSKPFLEKAWDLAKKIKVICLIKADPSTKWWAIFWDYEKHEPKPGCEVRFLPKRVKFVKPDGTESGSANFPSAVVIMDRRNIQ